MEISKHILKNENQKPRLSTGYADQYVKKGMDRDSGKLVDPDIIVLHYTATLNVESDIRTLFESDKTVSVHFVVDLNGDIYQLMPLDRIAWHAGKSHFKGRKGINKYSIGIEIVNPGYVNQTADDKFRTWYGKSVSADKVEKHQHKNESFSRFWHIYTEEQIDSVMQLCQSIKDNYPIQYILGHDDVSPGRKIDPGPALPMDKIRNTIFGDRKKEEDPNDLGIGYVNVPKLNIRDEGSIDASKVALPLEMNKEVDIMEEKNGWYKVETKISGWVSSKYIKRLT